MILLYFVINTIIHFPLSLLYVTIRLHRSLLCNQRSLDSNIFIEDVLLSMETIKSTQYFNKKSMFILTPTLKGGSIESIFTYLPEEIKNKYGIYVISADSNDAAESVRKKYKSMYVFNLHVNNIYRRYIVLFERIPMLKLLYFSILLMWQMLVLIKYLRKNSIIIFNGFTNSIIILFLLPLFKYFKTKTIVSYHGFPILRSRVEVFLIKILSKLIDYVLVNSIFTAYTFRRFYNIRCYYLFHNFDISLLAVPCKTKNANEKITLIYPGPRIDYEKSVFPFLLFALRNCNSRDFEFIFLGYDNLNIMSRISTRCKNIKYFGFLNNYDEYIQILSSADICWSNSEITYLTRPAIECLLLGKPVIIPDKPAVLGLENYRPIRIYLPDGVYIISHDRSIYDSKLISHTIKEILGNSQLCTKIKYKIKQYLETRYKFNLKLLNFILD